MFEISDRFSPVHPEPEDRAYENDRYPEINQLIPQLGDATTQKISLSRGSAQSRFAPQPYYYLASKSGVMPSWVIDDIQRRSRGGRLNQ